MKDTFVTYILHLTQAIEIAQTEVIQELWSGYGQILRCVLNGGSSPSVVVKRIDLDQANFHPRGWNTNTSHQRKIQSYINETYWYTEFNNHLPKSCRTPELLGELINEGQRLLVLEDLDSAGYPKRKSKLSLTEVQVVLKWLASFHSFHLNASGKELWEIGSYWHLATRTDEWHAIKDKRIKKAAKVIDQHLNLATYQTLIHGDAKVANFCFSKGMDSVAAVDFQYTGKGVGVKDVVYFLGSCLDEFELKHESDSLLDYYFEHLKSFINHYHPQMDEAKVEEEWRNLYTYAWADFTRFLLGWMPTHQKLNSFAHQQMESALDQLKQNEHE